MGVEQEPHESRRQRTQQKVLSQLFVEIVGDEGRRLS